MQPDFECLILCKWGKKIETRSGSGLQNMVDLPVQFSNLFWVDVKSLAKVIG
jgi:hypothetical protein